MRLARRTIISAAMAWLYLGQGNAQADVVVLSSTDAAVVVGTRLKDEETLRVGAGSSVSVLTPDGRNVSLQGPVETSVKSIAGDSPQISSVWVKLIEEMRVAAERRTAEELHSAEEQRIAERERLAVRPRVVIGRPQQSQGAILAQMKPVSVTVRASEEIGAAVVQKVELYPRSWALVIGIDAYSGGGWPALSNAVKDAEAVKGALVKHGFNVTLLKNPDSASLKRALEDFFIRQGNDPDARMLLWFAGHGHTVKNGNQDAEGYLVPADGPAPSDDVDFRLKAVSLREFGRLMREARARHVLAVFDACFAGTVFDTARSRPPTAITLATTEPVRQFISSGEADQTVSDNGEFRKLFVDALSGQSTADANRDGYLTAAELGFFLSDKITNGSGGTQTPRYGKLRERGFDRGDFIFAARNDKLAMRADASVPLSGERAVSDDDRPMVRLLREARQDWDRVRDTSSPEALQKFIEHYRGTAYAALAAEALARLRKQPAKPSAVKTDVMVRGLQYELKRLGCYTGDITGNWEDSLTAVTAYNTHASDELRLEDLTLDRLSSLAVRADRICPLVCKAGEMVIDEACLSKPQRGSSPIQAGVPPPPYRSRPANSAPSRAPVVGIQ